uniref:Uncharacterized protein n=1 Tax=Rhizophora mucronata TaxID=61149 RepID=A0A2P2LIU6_RHIMU
MGIVQSNMHNMTVIQNSTKICILKFCTIFEGVTKIQLPRLKLHQTFSVASFFDSSALRAAANLSAANLSSSALAPLSLQGKDWSRTIAFCSK